VILDSIQLVVLDMAGTTVSDTFSVHDSMIKAFQDHNLKIDRKIASNVLAVPKPIGINCILVNHFKIINSQLVKNIHNSFKVHMNSYYRNSDLVSETKDTARLFDYLKDRKIKIVLDTGFSKETADLIIDRLQWHSTIDGLVCSDDPSIGRPKPDMIYKAMEMTGVEDSKYVVKVGDTPNDMLQGKNANCNWTIGVNSGAFSCDELEKAGADFIVKYPFEIITINENRK
jgi:phosphonatase-like hydrolase